MKLMRQILRAFAASVILVVFCLTQAQERALAQKTAGNETNKDTDTVVCSGTVTDASGKPVAGATVEYLQYGGNPFLAPGMEIKKQVVTGVDGSFEFQFTSGAGVLLARKDGLAPAWKQFNQRNNLRPAKNLKDQKLVLNPPGTLEGLVVDDTDKPLANVEVTVAAAIVSQTMPNGGRTFEYIMGKPARDCFSTRSDAAGHFKIDSFPTNAGAVFAVQIPGKALRPQDRANGNPEAMGFHTDDKDIKLVLETGGNIEGKIVSGEANQPLPVAQLTLQSAQPGFFGQGGHDPVKSGADGTFQINNVAAGSYTLRAVFGTNTPSDWVAENVTVSVEAGKTVRDINVTPTRGGLLEVAVLDKESRKPVSEVTVNAYKQNFPSMATSDSNGVARLRLLPGDYQLVAYRESMMANQSNASVEEGKTNHVDIEMSGPKKLAGTVTNPDGKPAVGVLVRMVGPSYGADGENNTTDANGKFSVELNQQSFGPNQMTPCILVRDLEHNLAAALEIEEDAKSLDLKLVPALTVTGKVTSGGKPVTNASATIVFWTGRNGMWLQNMSRTTNTPGLIEIPALPPGRKYGVMVTAPGYGQKSINQVPVTDAGRQELEPIELQVANLKLSGQVVDADDKPVAGCYVNVNGDGQPNTHAVTDREGRFTIPNVCEGRVQLSANSQNTYGNISAEGGDTNVVLRLGQTYSNNPGAKTHKVNGTLLDENGKPLAGAQVAVFPSNMGTHWIKAGADGTFKLNWSLEPWQAQQGGAILVARNLSRNLAGMEDLSEDITNLDIKLTPAVTMVGLVQKADSSALTGAQVDLQIKSGNSSYSQFNEQTSAVNAEGRFEFKCLPTLANFIIFASANGYGSSNQRLDTDAETNRVELNPFVLKLADRVLEGQVLNEDEKPASGVYVYLNGDGQPNGNVTTDSKGHFRFKVCEGKVQLYANSQTGSYAQMTADAGDTNVVITLSESGNRRQPSKSSLVGKPLPDLSSVQLAGDAAPAGQPVLLCLFDAGQRPSRHFIQQLDELVPDLREKKICVLGVQATVIADEAFKEWKTASPLSFPLGRVLEKSDKTKWASGSSLPKLVLTDANHQVKAEGFSLDELDDQIEKVVK